MMLERRAKTNWQNLYVGVKKHKSSHHYALIHNIQKCIRHIRIKLTKSEKLFKSTKKLLSSSLQHGSFPQLVMNSYNKVLEPKKIKASLCQKNI